MWSLSVRSEGDFTSVRTTQPDVSCATHALCEGQDGPHLAGGREDRGEFLDPFPIVNFAE